MVAYVNKNYAIYKVSDGYIVHNTDYDFKDKHTHIHNYNVAKQIIRNLLHSAIPDTRNRYLLISHIRLSDNNTYTKGIQRVMDKRQAKEKYINVNKGVARR